MFFNDSGEASSPAHALNICYYHHDFPRNFQSFPGSLSLCGCGFVVKQFIYKYFKGLVNKSKCPLFSGEFYYNSNRASTFQYSK